MENYVDFAVQKAVELLAIDSPTGYTAEAEEFVLREFRALGFAAERTAKGGILIDLGGESTDDALLLEAHADTLGGMVAEIKGDGRLRIVNVGGMNANNAEAENCRVVTKFSGSYEGTLQLINASVHVNGDYASTKRSWDTVEVVLDEAVESADDVKALGISVGDFVCFEPRTRDEERLHQEPLPRRQAVRRHPARFAKYLHDEGKTPTRRVYVHVTVYEEVGHGGSASVPAGVTEAISVDMGCVGAGLQCTERQVSICAKGLRRPVLLRRRKEAHRRRAEGSTRTTPWTSIPTTALTSRPRSARAMTFATVSSARASMPRTAMSAVTETACSTRCVSCAATCSDARALLGAAALLALGFVFYFAVYGLPLRGRAVVSRSRGRAGLRRRGRTARAISPFSRWATRLGLILVCLGLVLAAGTAGWVVSAGHGADDPEAQWVVVLGAGVNGTVPSQALRERLEAARDYLCALSGRPLPSFPARRATASPSRKLTVHV